MEQIISTPDFCQVSGRVFTWTLFMIDFYTLFRFVLFPLILK
jgi:hypothetical protein